MIHLLNMLQLNMLVCTHPHLRRLQRPLLAKTNGIFAAPVKHLRSGNDPGKK